MILKIFFALFLVFADSEPKQKRSESQKQIFAGCSKAMTQAVEVKKSVCECIVENLSLKANDYQLQQLAKQYSGEGQSLSGELGTYDADVADQCLKDSKWRMKLDSATK